MALIGGEPGEGAPVPDGVQVGLGQPWGQLFPRDTTRLRVADDHPARPRSEVGAEPSQRLIPPAPACGVGQAGGVGAPAAAGECGQPGGRVKTPAPDVGERFRVGLDLLGPQARRGDDEVPRQARPDEGPAPPAGCAVGGLPTGAPAGRAGSGPRPRGGGPGRSRSRGRVPGSDASRTRVWSPPASRGRPPCARGGAGSLRARLAGRGPAPWRSCPSGSRSPLRDGPPGSRPAPLRTGSTSRSIPGASAPIRRRNPRARSPASSPPQSPAGAGRPGRRARRRGAPRRA